VLRIMNPAGARVDFYLQGEHDTVSGIVAAANEADGRALPSCD
jgi:hypothetical protein